MPLLLRLTAWVFVYLNLTSHLSGWKSQTEMIRRSPSLIHILFLILPGMRPTRETPSSHMTFILDAPRS